MKRQHTRSFRAFTIVELLVVVGILALLLGMLLPALAGAQKRSKKHKELNAIRQVGLGWTLYANANNDKLLPGYLGNQVQQSWRVKYEYPNHWDIPAGELAGPWTWRLLPYLDNDILTVHAYADEPGYETVELDPNSTGATPGGMASTARPIAYEPGFGYNAYYVGGWWTMDSGIARPLFYDAQSDEGRPINLLSRSVGTIIAHCPHPRRSRPLGGPERGSPGTKHRTARRTFPRRGCAPRSGDSPRRTADWP